MLKQKTGNAILNFYELHELHFQNNLYKDLYSTGTNLSKQKLEIFSWETTPGISIAKAVRISSGIPLYFEPVVLSDNYRCIVKKDTSSYRNYFVDGGILSNYQIGLFDSCRMDGRLTVLCEDAIFNQQTIGIKLARGVQIDSLQQNSITIPPFLINNLSSHANAFANIMMETLARQYPKLDNEKGKTIYMAQGNISPQVKKTKEKDKLLLYDNGKAAVERFLKQGNVFE